MKFLAFGLCLSCTILMSVPAVASEVALPAGTAVSVKLADAVDSARDPIGKKYAALVAAPVDIVGGQTIAAGSHATVVLVHNNSGWLTQLTALTVHGRTLDVASSAGTLITPEQASKPTSTGILGSIGAALATTTAPTSPHRVLLPPATQLRFLLIGTATAARPVATSPRPRSPVRTGPALGFSRAVSEQTPGIAYLCRARDRSDRVNPTSYYVADVFETFDDPAFVEKRWHEFLVATYPYTFANNAHATINCMRLSDSAAERDVRKKLENESKLQNAEIVETRWHYTLGLPPRPATSPTASTPVAERAFRPQTR
jgi:hypothetical protein